MNLTWHRTTWVFIAALALNCAAALGQDVTGSFERTLAIDGPVELDVATGSGSIVVRAGDAGRAQIVGRIVVRRVLRRGDEDAEELVRRFENAPPVELAGGRLRVGQIDDHEYYRNVSISYEIQVPVETRVSSRSGSGSQTVSGVRGPVEVSTGSGALTLTDLGGDVDARTGSGSIRADGIAGGFQAQTGSGSVSLVQTAPGDVVISTGSGGSDVKGIEGALRIRSGSGSITAEGTQQGPWDLEAGSGSVNIRLPPDAAFDLDAEGHSGEVYTDHPVAVQRRIARGRLSGQVRGGGPLLRVRTGSGGIRIQ